MGYTLVRNVSKFSPCQTQIKIASSSIRHKIYGLCGLDHTGSQPFILSSLQRAPRGNDPTTRLQICVGWCIRAGEELDEGARKMEDKDLEETTNEDCGQRARHLATLRKRRQREKDKIVESQEQRYLMQINDHKEKLLNHLL